MRTQTMNDYRTIQLEARVTEQLARLGRIVTAVEAGGCNPYEAVGCRADNRAIRRADPRGSVPASGGRCPVDLRSTRLLLRVERERERPTAHRANQTQEIDHDRPDPPPVLPRPRPR